MLVAALVSCVRLSYVDGAVAFSFEVTAVTAAILLAMWLPGLVKVIAIAGGGVKTPMGEVNAAGLLKMFTDLSDEAKLEVIPPVIAAIDRPELQVQPQGRAVRETLTNELADAYTAAPRSEVNELDRLAREYERVRSEMAPSRERTFEMATVLARMRAAARAANLDAAGVQALASSTRDGDRLAAIAALQERPEPSAIRWLLDAVERSRSAFEQYQALRALWGSMPVMSAATRNEVRARLVALRSSDGRGFLTPENADRYALSGQIIAELS
jgi:hypothetical protein